MNRIGPIERCGLTVLASVLSAMPPRCGQTRVVKSYLNRRPPVAGQLLPRTLAGGARFLLDPSDQMQASALLTRHWSAEIGAFATAALPTGGTFVDVGANIGLISLPLARRRPDVTVIAFEPHPTNVARWECHRALNSLSNARLEALGLSDRCGSSAMALSSDLGSGYVIESGDIPIALTTLDAYAETHGLARIDVLKIDVEGEEARVLDGAARLLRSGAIGRIIVEINMAALARAGFDDEDVISRIVGHGYTPTVIPPIRRRWRPAPADPNLVDLAFDAPRG